MKPAWKASFAAGFIFVHSVDCIAARQICRSGRNIYDLWLGPLLQRQRSGSPTAIPTKLESRTGGDDARRQLRTIKKLAFLYSLTCIAPGSLGLWHEFFEEAECERVVAKWFRYQLNPVDTRIAALPVSPETIACANTAISASVFGNLAIVSNSFQKNNSSVKFLIIHPPVSFGGYTYLLCHRVNLLCHRSRLPCDGSCWLCQGVNRLRRRSRRLCHGVSRLCHRVSRQCPFLGQKQGFTP